MPGRRLALLVASALYDDLNFRKLAAPSSDADELADVLSDEMLGGFETNVLRNADSAAICEEMDALLADCRSDDVVLLHFACHGVKHPDTGELHLAAKNTKHLRYTSTAISATTINTLISQSRAGTVLLLLDCCFGGAYAEGRRASGASEIDIESDFEQSLQGDGRGRVVITASSATEFAFEGARLVDDATRATSVFTRALIEGIRSGAADLDGDGRIRVDELYDYLYASVRAVQPDQTPHKSVSDVKGVLYVSLSPRRRVEPAELPSDLSEALHGNDINARLGAAHRLIRLAEGANLPLAAAARAELERLADDDSRIICDVADRGLRETSLTLSSTRLDLGSLHPGGATAPAAVRLVGAPVVQLSSANRHPGLRIRIDGYRLTLRPDTTTPGPFIATVTVSGPAGTAELTVTGTVVVTPDVLVQEAESICGHIEQPDERALGFSLVAAAEAVVGTRERALHLLAQARAATTRVADSRSYALLTAIRSAIGLLANDPELSKQFLVDMTESIRICVADRYLRTCALLAVGWLTLSTGSPAEASRIFDEARRSAAVIGKKSLARRLTAITVEWLRIRLGDGDRTGRFFQHASSAVRGEKGGPVETATLLLLLAWLAELTADTQRDDLPPLGAAVRRVVGARGSRAEALQLVAEARALVRTVKVGVESAWLLLLQGWVVSQVGQRVEAMESIETAEAVAANVEDDAGFRGAHTAAVTWVRARLGDRTRAAQLFTNAAAAVQSQTANPVAKSLMLALLAWAAGCTTDVSGERSGPVAQFVSWAVGVRSSQREVVELLSAAHGGIPKDYGRSQHAVLLVLFGWIESQVGERKRAVSSLNEAEQIASGVADDPALLNTLTAAASWVHARLGDQARAARFFTDLVAAVRADASGPKTTVALLLSLAGLASVTSGSAEARLRLTTIITQLGLPLPGWLPVVGRFLRWAIGVRGRRGQVTEILTEARAAIATVPDSTDRAWLLVLTIWVAHLVNERDVAQSALVEVELMTTVAVGDPANQDALRAAVGWVRVQLGDQTRAAWFFTDVAGAVRSSTADPARASMLLLLLAWVADFTSGSSESNPIPSTVTAELGEPMARWLPIAARVLHWMIGVQGSRIQVEAVLADARAAARSVTRGTDRAWVLVIAGWVESQVGESRYVTSIVEELRRVAHNGLGKSVLDVAMLACDAVIEHLETTRNGTSARAVSARLTASVRQLWRAPPTTEAR